VEETTPLPLSELTYLLAGFEPFRNEVSSAVSSCQMSYSCPHTSIAYHATIPQGAGQGLRVYGIINISWV